MTRPGRLAVELWSCLAVLLQKARNLSSNLIITTINNNHPLRINRQLASVHHDVTVLTSSFLPFHDLRKSCPTTSLPILIRQSFQQTYTMFRTALLRTAPRAATMVARPRTLMIAARPAAASARVAVPRVSAFQAVRMYSAGGSLNKEEVEGRIISLLSGFDKVSLSCFPSRFHSSCWCLRWSGLRAWMGLKNRRGSELRIAVPCRYP